MKKLLFGVTIIYLFTFNVKATNEYNSFNNYAEINSTDTTDTIVKTRGTLSLNPLPLVLFGLFLNPSNKLDYVEILQGTYGFNINNNYYIGGKFSLPNGLGLKFSRQFSEKFILGLDCINIEILRNILTSKSKTENLGWLIYFTVSSENITSKKVDFFYEIGVTVFTNKFKNYITPCFNLGISF